MKDPLGTVYVVEDDLSVRLALVSLLRSVGLAVDAHDSAEEFLAQARNDGPACLVLDMRLPESNGLDLQCELNRTGIEMPVIFITGHGTIPMTVQAMKAGAFEFLTKPFTDDAFLTIVRQALSKDRAALGGREQLRTLRAHYQTLTQREREVFPLVTAGYLNKQVAADLGISEITVKVHRRRIMSKLEVRTLPELVLAAERLGVRAKLPPGYTKV